MPATTTAPETVPEVAGPLASNRVRAAGDAVLEVTVAGFAWFTLLYWVGLATGGSLWPLGWVWLAGLPLVAAGVLWLRRSDREASPEPAALATRPDLDDRAAAGGPWARRARWGLLVSLVAVAVLLPWWPDTFTPVWLLVTLALALATLVAWRSGPDAADPEVVVVAGSTDRRAPAWLPDAAVLALAAAVGVLSLFILLPDLDDPFYVNRSLWVAERGNASLLDTMFGPERFPTPYNGGLPVGSIEAFIGVLAHQTGLHVGTLTWLVSTAVASAMGVWAYWMLARSWAVRAPLAVVAVAVLFMLLGGESRLGNFYIARIWQGKVIAVVVLLPMVWALLTELAGGPSRRRSRGVLVLTFLAGVAFVGLTSTAVILAPIITAGVVVAAALQRDRVLMLAGVLFSVAPVLSGAAVVLFSPEAVGGEEPRLLTSAESFLRVLGPDPVMAGLALLAVAVAPLLVRRRFAAVAVGVTGLACLLLFLPGMLTIVNAVTGAGPILWRVLLCLPIPVLVGLAAVRLVPTTRRTTPAGSLALTALPVALVMALVLVAGAPLWNTTDHNGPATLADRPSWKLDPEKLDDVEAFAASDPTGVVVLPAEQMRILSMYTTDAFAVVPRVWYAKILEQPRENRKARFLLMRAAMGANPLPSAGEVRRASRLLDVTEACVGPNRQQDRAVAVFADAGYGDPVERGRMVCLTR